jgi:hypothetical protein
MLLTFGAARPAEASCGDWLQMEDHRASPRTSTTDPTNAPLPCDCQGPMCRGQLPIPLAPPSREVEFEQQRTIETLQVRLESDAEVMSWKSLRGRAAERDGFPRLIDRPPRTA